MQWRLKVGAKGAGAPHFFDLTTKQDSYLAKCSVFWYIFISHSTLFQMTSLKVNQTPPHFFGAQTLKYFPSSKLAQEELNQQHHHTIGEFIGMLKVV